MKIDASEKIKRIQSILSENKQDFKKTFYHYSLFDLFMYLNKSSNKLGLRFRNLGASGNVIRG